MLPSSPRGEEGQEEKSNRPRGEEPSPPGAPGPRIRRQKNQEQKSSGRGTGDTSVTKGQGTPLPSGGDAGPRSPRHTSVSREGLSQGTQRSGDAQIKGG